MDCNCKKIHEELVFLYEDNEMGREMVVAYKRHLEDCPGCAQEAQYTHKLLMIVRQRVQRTTAPISLRERILAGLPDQRRPIS